MDNWEIVSPSSTILSAAQQNHTELLSEELYFYTYVYNPPSFGTEQFIKMKLVSPSKIMVGC